MITSISLSTPCKACGYCRGVVVRRKKSAFAIKCGTCDTFQFPISDEQLEAIANSLTVGGQDD